LEEAATVSGEKAGPLRREDEEAELRFDMEDEALLCGPVAISALPVPDNPGLATATSPEPSMVIVISSGSGLAGGSQLPLNKTYMRYRRMAAYMDGK
jgi:hypothetical protein